jgi:hypothetical protein
MVTIPWPDNVSNTLVDICTRQPSQVVREPTPQPCFEMSARGDISNMFGYVCLFGTHPPLDRAPILSLQSMEDVAENHSPTPQLRLCVQKVNPPTLRITQDSVVKHQSPSTLTLHGYIGQRGISLSGSYQQGYSTTYNTQLHIKVVCNGYILTHISNCNSRGNQGALPPQGDTPSCMTQGRSLFVCM